MTRENNITKIFVKDQLLLKASTISKQRRSDTLFSLHEQLTETINVEVSLGTIVDLESALQWLSTTYLFSRVAKNPSHYLVGPKEEPLSFLRSRVRDAVHILHQKEFISISETNKFKSTKFGAIMAKFGVQLKTMEMFINCSQSPTASKIVRLRDQQLSIIFELAAIVIKSRRICRD
jgi:replicative superfamily II helicase